MFQNEVHRQPRNRTLLYRKPVLNPIEARHCLPRILSLNALRFTFLLVLVAVVFAHSTLNRQNTQVENAATTK